MKWLLFILAACSLQATTVNCTNTSADVSALQAAVNLGGTVTVNGPCAMSSGTVTISNAVSIQGGTSPTLNGSSTSPTVAFTVNSNNVTINGLTFNGLIINSGSAQYYTNFVFTNNTIENVYSAVYSQFVLSLTAVRNSTINGNIFENLWGGGSAYPATPPNDQSTCGNGLQEDCWGWGGISISSIDQTSISNNTFTEVSTDGMHILWTQSTGYTNPYVASANIISGNKFSLGRRIPMELQAQPSNSCPGGCNYSVTVQTGFLVSNNYVSSYSYPYFDTYGMSAVPGSTSINSQYLNNTFIATPASPAAAPFGGYAYCIEEQGNNILVQGNVCSSSQTSGYSYGYYASAVNQSTGSSSATNTYQNNTFCGSTSAGIIQNEAASPHPTILNQYNWLNTSTCPSGMFTGTSSITSSVQSFTYNSGAATISQTVGEVSNLSIILLSWNIDGGAAIANQTISNVSTTFGTDRTWRYSLIGYSVAGLAAGSHTLNAVATDVSGATSTVSSNFSIGGSGTVTLSPASLTFGNQVVSTTSMAQVVTLTNGTASTVTISSIGFSGGTNYGQTHTCGGTLAASATCTVSVTFTPTTTGTLTDSLNIVVTGTGTLSTSLSGVGVAASPCGSPNIILNCEFTSGTTDWTFSAGGSTSTGTVDNTGPGGMTAYHITASGTFTGVPELRQDSLTYGANGTNYYYALQIAMSRPQGTFAYAILDVSPYTNYGLVFSPGTQLGTANTYGSYGMGFVTINSPTASAGRITLQFTQILDGDQFWITLVKVSQTGTSTSGQCLLTSVDQINQFGARVAWEIGGSQPPTLQYHELVWLPTITYVANGSSFGSNPNVVGLNSMSVATDALLAGILFNAPASTDITFAPISSDTTAVTNGVYSSANACTNVVGTFTTGPSQSFVQVHPTPPTIFVPPTTFTISGTTWTEGSNCGTGTPSGATMMACINAANNGSPTDGVLLANTNHVCTAFECVMPSPPSGYAAFTVTGSSPATFQTTTTTPFTDGQQVTVWATGYLPAPLVQGPAGNATQDPVYYVCIASCGETGNNFQLKDYTNTLVSTLSTGSSGTLYAQAWPPFSGSYHIIDVQTSSSLLPPNGVRLDPVAYGSRLAVVTFDNASLGDDLFVGNWIWRHTEFTSAPTGSIADPIGVPPLIYLDTGGTSGGVDHVVFDQDWFNGPTRPDRLSLAGVYLGGANVAIQNSAFTNMQSWVPAKGADFSATGSVVTAIASNNWYQGHNCTTQNNLSATLGGTGAVNFYFDQSCNPTIAPGTGVTVGSATGWTVLPTATVVAGTFPLDGNSRWSVYPIGYATVTGGSVTAVDENSVAPSTCGAGEFLGPSEGIGTCTTQQLWVNTTGPYAFVNNSFDGTGILGPYFNATSANGCQTSGGTCPAIPAQAHDTYMARNVYNLHPNWVQPLGSPWDFGWSNMRNGPEFKGIQRLLIDGDFFNTMLADVDPGGTCLGVSNLTGGYSQQVANDIEIRNTTALNCSEGLNIVGFYSSQPANAVPVRIWFHNNVGTFNLNPDNLFTSGQLYPNGAMIAQSNTIYNLIAEHNTWLGRGGFEPGILFESGGPCMGCWVQNNLTDFTASTGGTAYPDILYGNAPGPPVVPAIPSNGSALIAATQSTVASNVWIPTWTSYNSGAPISWTSGQLTPYTGAWTAGITFQPGSTYAATTGSIGWFGVNALQSALSNLRLLSTSSYVSGAHVSTDGLDIGANIDQLEAAQGKVTNLHVSATATSTGFQLTFVAPDSFGCTVDTGSTAFWTGSGSFTRTANGGGQRVQTVSLSGPANSLVYWRVNCASVQPTGSIQLP
jgi:hypothetical protein